MKKQRLARLERHLSTLSGKEVEITIRGLKSFTISFIGESKKASQIITDYFEDAVKELTYDYDLECDHTAIFLEA